MKNKEKNVLQVKFYLKQCDFKILICLLILT